MGGTASYIEHVPEVDVRKGKLFVDAGERWGTCMEIETAKAFSLRLIAAIDQWTADHAKGANVVSILPGATLLKGELL